MSSSLASQSDSAIDQRHKRSSSHAHGQRSRIAPLSALSLQPYKLTNLPLNDNLVPEALAILADSRLWKPGKLYNGTQICMHTIPINSSGSSGTLVDQLWCCAKHEWQTDPPPNTNIHEPTPTLYTHLWNKISKNRIPSQRQYIPEIVSTIDIKTISRSRSIWSVSYNFGSPLSPRICAMLQVLKLIANVPGTRTGIAITIPVDLNDSSENLAVLEDLGVKGRFVSIEHLKEYEGGRIIEWRKILCGEFGGLIPRFCVRRSMPEKLAQDAQRFLQWVVEPETEVKEEREDGELKLQTKW